MAKLTKRERMIRLFKGAINSPKVHPNVKKAFRLKLKKMGVRI